MIMVALKHGNSGNRCKGEALKHDGSSDQHESHDTHYVASRPRPEHKQIGVSRGVVGDERMRRAAAQGCTTTEYSSEDDARETT